MSPVFGIRYDFRCPDVSPASMDDLYATALEQCEWAERLGFDAVVLSEHHGSDDGYLPSLTAMAAAIAARTEHLNIRMAALVAPIHDPLRVAEDLAVVDLISRGRLTVVVSNGYVPSEFTMFGHEVSDRVRLTTEMVETLKLAWTGEPFEFRGRTVRVTPRPYQRPRPQIWLGGASEPAARRAARIADLFMPTLPELWDTYRDELRVLGKPDVGPMPPGFAPYLHVSEDPEATWDTLAPHAMHEMNAYGRWAAESGAATGYQPVDSLEALRATGMYAVLTPDECIEMIRGLGDGAHVYLHPLMGGLDPELSWQNLRLFEDRVLPNVQ